MSIDFKQVAALHGAALQLRTERTRILAANLANESTPGFRARDLDFPAALAEQLAGDDGLPALSDDATSLYRLPYQPRGDGNTVETGVEQAAFSQNAVDLQTGLSFLGIKFRGLAQAINGH